MSGEMEGLFIGILALPLIAVAGAGYLVYQTGRAVYHGGKALYNYSQRKKAERELELNGVSDSLKQTLSEMNQISGRFNAEYDKLLENTAHEMMQTGTQFQQNAQQIPTKNLEQYQEKIKQDTKKLNQKFEQDYAEVKRHYIAGISSGIHTMKNQMKSEFQKHQQELNALKANRTAYQEKARKLSESAIAEIREQLAYMQKYSSESSLYRDKMQRLQMELNLAVGNYNKGMYEACYASSENLKYVAMDIFQDMLVEKHEYETYHAMLTAEIEKMKSLVTENSEIRFEYEDCTMKSNIYDYSEGLINALNHRIDAISSEVNGSGKLSLERMKACYKELTEQLEPSFHRIFSWSMKNLENSYIRKDIAETISETLEDQNFVMTESGYKGGSETHDMYIKFKNLTTKEEVMVILKPDDSKKQQVGTKYEVHQLTDGINPDRQEELRRDILHGVTEYYHTHNITASPCLQNSIGKASHLKGTQISDIKKQKQERTPNY